MRSLFVFQIRKFWLTVDFNLTEEDKVGIGHIRTKLEDNEELRAVMDGNNTLENKRYKFEQILDSLLLEFVHDKLDLFKKLTEPKANSFLKSRWFEEYWKE